jgi:hypothetical protein
MNENHEIMHSFSRAQAKLYGVNAAIVLSYISYRIARSTNIRDGKRWYFDSFDALAQHYPYFSKTVVYQAVQPLISANGPLILEQFHACLDRQHGIAVRCQAVTPVRLCEQFGFHDARMVGQREKFHWLAVDLVMGALLHHQAAGGHDLTDKLAKTIDRAIGFPSHIVEQFEGMAADRETE